MVDFPLDSLQHVKTHNVRGLNRVITSCEFFRVRYIVLNMYQMVLFWADRQSYREIIARSASRGYVDLVHAVVIGLLCHSLDTFNDSRTSSNYSMFFH